MDENPVLVYKCENPSLVFSLYSIEHKFDEKGSAQCSKYVRTTANSNSFNSYGLSFKQLLSNALHCNEKYTITPYEGEWKGKCFVVKYAGNAHRKSENDSLFLQCVLKAFDIDIKEEKRNVDAFQLKVSNANILERFRTDDSVELVSIHDKIISATAVSLNDIAKTYDNLYPEFVVYVGKDTNHYNMELPLKKAFFQNNTVSRGFGLEFQKVKSELPFFIVSPK